MILHRATLETRNFAFEAIGAAADDARALLIRGLQRHAKEYRLASDWYDERRRLRGLLGG